MSVEHIYRCEICGVSHSQSMADQHMVGITSNGSLAGCFYKDSYKHICRACLKYIAEQALKLAKVEPDFSEINFQREPRP